MALNPAFRCFTVAGAHDAPHTLDVFLDYTCPYSGKISHAINTILIPFFAPGGKHAGKVKIIIRLHPQPWHAQSTFTHEAALAVARVAPDSFWTFSKLLLKHQTEYFDIPTRNLTPLQIRANLAALASQVLTKEEVEQFKDLLLDKGSLNDGVAVTSDLKYHVKYARQNGIHFSPTVMWDGLIAPEVSSGWDEEKWVQFLDAKVIA